MNYGFSYSAAKRIGLVVSIGTVVYKLLIFLLCHDLIFENSIFASTIIGPKWYFSLYLTSIVTACSCVTPSDMASKVISFIMIPILGLFLGLDGLYALTGCAFTDSTVLWASGIHPVVNILLIYINVAILKEILGEERRIRKTTNQVNVYPPGISPGYNYMPDLQNMNGQIPNPYGPETQAYGTTDADKEYRDKYGSDAFGG